MTLVHCIKKPLKTFCAIEDGSCNTVHCHDPDNIISLGDLLYIFLIDVKTERLVRKIKRRVTGIVKTYGEYKEVSVTQV